MTSRREGARHPPSQVAALGWCPVGWADAVAMGVSPGSVPRVTHVAKGANEMGSARRTSRWTVKGMGYVLHPGGERLHLSPVPGFAAFC